MKIFNQDENKQPQLMIIPMIDIIFFLLVFFMISTMSMVEQHTFPVQLPSASAAKVDNTKTIPITVLANGKIKFNDEEIAPEFLGKRIDMEISADKEEPGFVLRGDKTVSYDKIVNVLDELKRAGSHKVAIAVEQKR